MGIYDKRRSPVRVQAAWMHGRPSRPGCFWVEVGRRVKNRRIRHNDSLRIGTIVSQVEREWQQKLKPK